MDNTELQQSGCKNKKKINTIKEHLLEFKHTGDTVPSMFSSIGELQQVKNTAFQTKTLN